MTAYQGVMKMRLMEQQMRVDEPNSSSASSSTPSGENDTREVTVAQMAFIAPDLFELVKA